MGTSRVCAPATGTATGTVAALASAVDDVLGLSALLNLSPSEAGRRVRHARQLRERLSPSGQLLPTLCSATAEGRAAGRITDEHASLFFRTLQRLPGSLPVEQVTAAEEFLVGWATKVDARQRAGIARRLLDTLDPDGDLTAECGALATAVLSSLSAPQLDSDDGTDHHDG